MRDQEVKLSRLLDMKYQAAEARLVRARDVRDDFQRQMEDIAARRNCAPEDPADQLNYERHIAWLDRRARELGVLASQAAVEFAVAREALKVEFGRKTAFAKILTQRRAEEKLKASRQLS